MSYRNRLIILSVLLVLATKTAFAACSLHQTTSPTALQTPNPTPVVGAQTYQGETKPFGNGTISTWVTLDASNKPLALGVTFDDRALTGQPAAMPFTEYPLALPPQATAAGLPFTHFVANWNPHGHIPPGIFDVPHFDFHFYVISSAVRESITLIGENRTLVMKTPPVAAIPPDYITAPGTEEPRMGVHWVDATSPEFHGQPFTQTFVYGYYNGQLAFLEPMMTTAYLQTQPNTVLPIKQPSIFPIAGYYPTQYAIHYDAAHDQYRIDLQNFVQRSAATTPAPVTAAGLPLVSPVR